MVANKDGAVLEKVAVDAGLTKNIKTYQNTVSGIALPLNEKSATADTIKGGVEVNTNNKLYCNSDGTILDIDSISGGSTVSVVDPFNDNSGVALYQLDGNANDTSGNYNGTWSGTEAYSTGKFGQAAKFNGSSYIENDTFSSNGFTAVTYSFWAQLSNATGSIISFGGSDDMGIQLVGGETVRVYYRSNLNFTDISNFFILDSLWHYYTITSDSYGTSCYRDKILIGTSGQKISKVSSPFYMFNGAKGFFDQVRIFNRALIATEVDKLYNENNLILDITSNNLSNPPTNIMIKPNLTTLESATTSDKQANKTYAADVVDTETIDYTTGEYKTTYKQQTVANPDRMLVHKITADLNTQVNSIETEITT